MSPSIRTLAICVFRHGGRILVAQGRDDVKNETFLRPLGGAVEFGESIVDALRREIREELDAEIVDPIRLGVIENVFTYNGEPGHEIVFVHDARFADARLYESPSLPLKEPVWEGPARWIDLASPPTQPLYPDGLARLLGVATRSGPSGQR